MVNLTEAALLLLLYVTSVFFSIGRLIFFSPRSVLSLKEKKHVSPRQKKLIDKTLSDKNIWYVSVICSSIASGLMFVAFLSLSKRLDHVFQIDIPSVIKLSVVFVLFILFSEVLPRMLTLRFGISFIEIEFFVLNLLTKPLYPLLVCMSFLEVLAGKLFRKKNRQAIEGRKVDITEVELAQVLLQKEEKQLLENVLNLRSKPARKVMTPRADVVGVEISESLTDVLGKISISGYSRLPLYEKDLDDIKGIVYAKNLIKNLSKRSARIDWKKVARTPIFVPETQYLSDVLSLFQKKKMHVAIVIDEYGGVAGIVTLDDIVEELLDDLSKGKENKTYRKIRNGLFWFDASTPIEQVEEVLSMKFLADIEADTLGGFILTVTGDVPEQGKVIDYDGLTFTVEKVEVNRIVSCLVSLDKNEKKSN